MAFSSSTSTWWFIFLLFYFCPPSLLAVEVTQAFLCCTCNCFTTVVFVPSVDRYHPSIPTLVSSLPLSLALLLYDSTKTFSKAAKTFSRVVILPCIFYYCSELIAIIN